MAPHIALEETGAPYEARLISTAKREQKTEDYLAINPRGKVPALRIGSEVLTENAAILTYIGRRFPEANLLPRSLMAEMQCLSTMVWLSNTVHVNFRQAMRPERFASDPNALSSVKKSGTENFWSNLQEVNMLLAGRQWMVSEQYTVCDPYLLVFYAWAVRIDLPVHELGSFTALKNRLMARAAVQTVLKRENSTLLSTGALSR
jgi:glutathione S-transferase